jgi:hypothetical protein
MQLNFKKNQEANVKRHLKKNNIILLSNGSNQNAQDWLDTEQGLYKLNINYYKTYNNAAFKIIKNTIFKNFINIVSNTLFFFTLKNSKKKSINLLLKNLQKIKFNFYNIKLNCKVYQVNQFKKVSLYPIKYYISIKVLYQFLSTNIKLLHILR